MYFYLTWCWVLKMENTCKFNLTFHGKLIIPLINLLSSRACLFHHSRSVEWYNNLINPNSQFCHFFNSSIYFSTLKLRLHDSAPNIACITEKKWFPCLQKKNQPAVSICFILHLHAIVSQHFYTAHQNILRHY